MTTDIYTDDPFYALTRYEHDALVWANWVLYLETGKSDQIDIHSKQDTLRENLLRLINTDALHQIAKRHAGSIGLPNKDEARYHLARITEKLARKALFFYRPELSRPVESTIYFQPWKHWEIQPTIGSSAEARANKHALEQIALKQNLQYGTDYITTPDGGFAIEHDLRCDALFEAIHRLNFSACIDEELAEELREEEAS